MRRRAAVLGMALVAGTALAACSDGGSNAGSPDVNETTPSTSASTTTLPPTTTTTILIISTRDPFQPQG